MIISSLIGARFVSNMQLAQKWLWAHLIELLDDVGQVEACFYLFGDSVSLGAR
jgi:hypothetical protein